MVATNRQRDSCLVFLLLHAAPVFVVIVDVVLALTCFDGSSCGWTVGGFPGLGRARVDWADVGIPRSILDRR